jgi:hypothetical protein
MRPHPFRRNLAEMPSEELTPQGQRQPPECALVRHRQSGVEEVQRPRGVQRPQGGANEGVSGGVAEDDH